MCTQILDLWNILHVLAMPSFSSAQISGLLSHLWVSYQNSVQVHGAHPLVDVIWLSPSSPDSAAVASRCVLWLGCCTEHLALEPLGGLRATGSRMQDFCSGWHCCQAACQHCLVRVVAWWGGFLEPLRAYSWNTWIFDRWPAWAPGGSRGGAWWAWFPLSMVS